MESAFSGALHRPGLCLIETLAWDGARAPRGAAHAARMAGAARRLGFPFAKAGFDAALAGAAPKGAPARLRITLDAAGAFRAEAQPLPPPLALWRLTLSPQRLSSTDPWLSVKSSQRPLYDAARAALPPGVDEVIFANERGEICEGTITTLFFDRGAGLCTPPLSCGLLPGVLRAALLAEGAREEVLRLADLPRVRLFAGNALRGLAPAVLLHAPA